MKKALYQTKGKENRSVNCLLCPHNCSIAKDKTGFCNIRKNVNGELYSLIYDIHSSVAVDPVEKKPLYHFYPGSEVLSFGSFGCNLSCRFCQNWQISQTGIVEEYYKKITSEEAVDLAIEKKSIGIAYTYNEPLINYEWVVDASKTAKSKNLKNILVTNGYINEEPLHNIIPYIDAANIDIKSFRNDFYKRNCSGSLSPVLRTSEIMFKAGIHIEFTVLLIPGDNDSNDEILDLIDWVSALSVNIPVHFSRYFPNYKCSAPQTPEDTLLTAKKLSEKKLKFVFLGNVASASGSDTICPSCGSVLIKRSGYSAESKNIKTGVCSKCKTPVSTFGIKI